MVDAFASPQCLHTRPEVIAAACLWLESQVSAAVAMQQSGVPVLALELARLCNLFGLKEEKIIDAAEWIGRLPVEHCRLVS
jgi:hypothetical protein